MKYLSKLILILLPLLLATPHLFAADTPVISEEEEAKQAIAEEECT